MITAWPGVFDAAPPALYFYQLTASLFIRFLPTFTIVGHFTLPLLPFAGTYARSQLISFP